MTSADATGYENVVRVMRQAAVAWLREHPFAEPEFRTEAFEAEVARRAHVPPGKAAIAAALSDVVDQWAANEDARVLLRAMNRAATEHGTYLQARAILDELLAKERVPKLLPAEGDWRCTGCMRDIRGFFQEQDELPGPGDYSVCGECGVIQRVNGAATGYVAVSAADLRRLPKSTRMALLALQKQIKAQIAEEQARS